MGASDVGTSRRNRNPFNNSMRFPDLEKSPWAIKKTLSKESRTKSRGEGDVSPFSALTTALAATIGTGNIVGSSDSNGFRRCWSIGVDVDFCMFWITSKFSECMLAIKYREVNEKGEMSGGPMYTMKKALKTKSLELYLGGCLLYLP